MGFSYVHNLKLVNSTLDYAERERDRENSIPRRRRVFTDEPSDTQIRFVPSYLLRDGQDVNGENIVYSIDKTMSEALIITRG